MQLRGVSEFYGGVRVHALYRGDEP
jgi:hypothetical protein